MLTNLILGIIVTGGMLYGLYLMRGLDHFLLEQKDLQKKSVKRQKAIIFGKDSEKEKIAAWFENAGVKTIYLENIYIDKSWKQIAYLAAVSNSDIDNLSVCNLFSTMYPEIQTFSLCNDKNNLKLFRQAHIQVFTEKEELLQRLELLTMENEVGAA